MASEQNTNESDTEDMEETHGVNYRLYVNRKKGAMIKKIWACNFCHTSFLSENAITTHFEYCKTYTPLVIERCNEMHRQQKREQAELRKQKRAERLALKSKQVSV